jgi:hypothetical protein
MKRSLLAWLVSGFLVFVGCATGYHGRGFTGGYSDVRLDANTFRVDFRGNALTSRQTVETHLLRRCAELTAEAGYDYFIVMDSNTEAREQARTRRGSFEGTTTFYGNSATTSGTYRPGTTFVYTRYGASAVIKAFKGEKPANNAYAYNAREVLQYLGSPTTAATSQQVEKTGEPPTKSPKPEPIEAKPSDESQISLQSRPEPVKRYAQLTHTKGPFVTSPPQVLRAECIDTGERHGSARVIYPNNRILEGAYHTIASGESFNGLVKATLIDPDRVGNVPGSGLRGFAAFAGEDGTVLECAYAVTSPSGSGSGTCVDNQKNQYRLSF